MILTNLCLPETLKNDLIDFATVSGTSYFKPNIMSPNRKFVLLNKIEHRIKHDVQEFAKNCYAQFDIEVKEEPVFGNFLGFISRGGAVHAHQDPSPLGFEHVRLNFMVSKPLGGDPVINGKILEVAENQCWLNLASLWMHESTEVQGETPRIVLSLGNLVPNSKLRNFGPLV